MRKNILSIAFLALLCIFSFMVLTGCGAGGGEGDTTTIIGGGGNTPTPSNGKVTGNVTDSITGNAISGVTVAIGGQSTVTDAYGYYEISNISAGTQTVTATRDGYNNFAGTVTVNSNATVIYSIQMVSTGPPEDAGTVTGKVTELMTAGTVIPDVLVSIGGQSATTDANGIYTISGLLPGDQSVTAVKEGYNNYTGTVAVEASGNVTYNFQMGKPVQPLPSIGEPKLILQKTGIPLRDFWLGTDGHIWAVGDGGLVLHYTPNTDPTKIGNWIPQCKSPTDHDSVLRLFAIWGVKNDNIYACGGESYIDANTGAPTDSGFIYHYDGTTWSKTLAGDEILRDLDGTSASDIFCVGGHDPYYKWVWQPLVGWTIQINDRGESTILYFDGSSWTEAQKVQPPAGEDPPPEAALRSVWANPFPQEARIAYAVGDCGIFWSMYYDRSQNVLFWQMNRVPSEMGDGTFFNRIQFERVWAKSAIDGVFRVYASATNIAEGLKERVYNLSDQPGLQPAPEPQDTEGVSTVGALWPDVDSGDLYLNWNFGAPVVSDNYLQINDIFGASTTNILAGGYSLDTSLNEQSMLYHYDGTSWTEIPEVHTAGPNYIDGRIQVIHEYREGANFGKAVILGGYSNFFDWDWQTNTMLKSLFSPYLSRGFLYGVWTNDATSLANARAYMVGQGGQIAYWNGTNWALDNSPTTNTLYGVWGSSTSDVFAAGILGTIVHFDGTAWTTFAPVTQEHLYGVWGTSGSNVYAVGDSGTILHYDGASWIAEPSVPTISNLHGIWGTSPSNIYAVGDSGTILHYDGTSWTIMENNTTDPIPVQPLWAVWGPSAENVYAVGERGTVLHYGGSNWESIDTNGALNNSAGYGVNLRAIWGSVDLGFVVAGWDTVVAQYDGANWTRVQTCMPIAFYGVFGFNSKQGFINGDYGTVLKFDLNATPTP